MLRRRRVRGALSAALALALLGALTIAVVTTASAAVQGSKWVGCNPHTLGAYKDANCTESATAGAYYLGRVYTPSPFRAVGSNYVLSGKASSGQEFKLSCAESTATGTVESKEEEKKKVATGTAAMSWSGCSVGGIGFERCKVQGGTISGSSARIGLVSPANFELKPSKVIAQFTFEGCAMSTLNKLYQVEGSIAAKLVGPGTAAGPTNLEFTPTSSPGARLDGYAFHVEGKSALQVFQGEPAAWGPLTFQLEG